MAQSVYDDYVREVRAEEERYAAEADAYNAYVENELMELENVAKMLPAGGITAIFADEYIREQELREEYERTIERSDRGSEILQGTWVDTSRGVESSPEGRAVSENVGGRVLEGENAVAQGGETGGIAEREVRAERIQELGVEGDSGDEPNVADEANSVIKPIGRGVFGNIYDQFKGKAKDAVQFLLNRKEGEAIGALHHPEVGDIDLVWGKEGTGKSDGFGLAKLAKYHPEVLDNIQEILDDMHVTQRTVNRVQMESDTHQAAVRLTWDNEQKNWLLTAFEKRNSVFDNTTDTAETSKQGKRNDTTTSQSTVSVGKDTGNSVKVNDLGVENDVLSVQEQVKAAESEVNTNPTEGQKAAGNYKKGHVQIGKFNITIEQPKGSVRRGVDANGNKWETEMQNTYGYIRGTEGVDGDHIDVFLSDDIDGWDGMKVFVIDQYNEDGSFDEHKVMLGFNETAEAHKAYLSNYSKDWSSKHKNIVTSVSIGDFEKWIDSSHRKTKAFAEYKTVNTTEAGKSEAYMPNVYTYINGISEGNREVIRDWEREFRDYISSLGVENIASIEHTIGVTQKKLERFARDKSSADYKAYDFIIRKLEHRLRELTKGDKADERNVGDRANEADGTTKRGDRGALIEYSAVAPKGIKWREAVKYKDADYRWSTVQLQPSGEDLWVRLSGTYKGNVAGQVQYYKIPNYKSLSYNDVILSGIDKGIATRHFEDAVLNFYVKNRINPYSILRPMERPKRAERVSDRKTERQSEDDVRFRGDSAELWGVANDFYLTKDNQADFEYALMQSIAGKNYSSQYGYNKIGDVLVRVKSHTANWDRFEDLETGEPLSDKILNVTVGDYDNTDYRRNKASYEDFMSNHPDVKAVDVEIDDGFTIGESLEKITTALKEKGISISLQPNDFWKRQYSKENNDLSESVRFRDRDEDVLDKAEQLRIIQETNPAPNDVLAWIRSVEDIKTYEESLNDSDYVDYAGADFDPSYPWDIAEEALRSGEITVYSSLPIVNGAFVTPSRMEAESYGDGSVYRAKVRLSDVAWIDPTQGQLATENSIEVKREASEYRFRENALEIKDKYGIDYAGDTDVLYSKNDLEKIRAKYGERVYEIVERNYNKPKVYGVSLPLLRKAFLFEEKLESEELSWWHEQTHIIYEELEYADKEQAGLAAMEWLRNKGGYYGLKHYEDILKYPKEEWASEAAARMIEHTVDKYGTKRFLSFDFVGSGNVLKLANAIRNKFIYGTEEPTERDILRRRQILERRGLSFERRGESENTSQDRFGRNNTHERSRGDYESSRTGSETRSGREGEESRIKAEGAQSLGKELGEDVVIASRDEIPGVDSHPRRRTRVTGWYNGRTGAIHVVVENCRSVEEARVTVLHEAIGHKGMRELLGKDYDAFLDRVYDDLVVSGKGDNGKKGEKSVDGTDGKNVSIEERERRRVIADEYIADRAEQLKRERPGLWSRIVSELRRLIGKLFNIRVTDKDIDYLLWKARKRKEAGAKSNSGYSNDSDYSAEVKGERAKGERFRFIGEKGAESLDKAEEATTRLDNLAVAREMEAAGKDAKSVKMATGWERGADGAWRYEVSDGKFDVRGELHPERRRLSKEEELELDNAFDELMYAFEKGSLAYDKEITEDTDMADIYVAGGMPRERAERLLSLEDKEKKLKKSKKHLDDYLDDDNLYLAYPELREIDIAEGDPMRALTGQLGGYNPKTKTLTLYDLSKDTLLHEVQHIIQHIEGFARGGSAKSISEARRLNNQVQREVESLLNQLDINEWLSREDIQDVILRNQKEGRYFNLGYAFSESLNEIVGAALRQKLDEANRAIAENNRMIGGSSNLSPSEHYRRLGGEVEARNVSRRMGMSDEERRNSLAEETEDVSRADKIFIMDGLGVSEMGSRVEGRMAEIGKHFENQSLSEDERAVVDVFSGARNNLTINVKTKDVNRSVVVRQGTENKAGTKHSLFRHYDTGVGTITADDIKLIPEIIANGSVVEKKRGKSTLNEYKQTINGDDYTVLTEVNNRGYEVLADFYTNKSGKAHSFNTNSIAQEDSITTFNDKFSDKSLENQISEEDIRFREIEDEERDEMGELGGGVPWGDGETLADAMSRVRRKRNRLVIEIDKMERRREAGKPIDEMAFDDAKAELAQAEKDLRYMEIGPDKPELADGESERDASYVAKMEHWREMLLEWKGKKYDEDEYMDSFLRNATGERADMSDEELQKLLESEKDKRNTSIKEMKTLIKAQIRERRRNIEVSNWEDEVTIKNIKDKTTQEERELIPHILEGSYSILPSKDMRYAEYLEELRVRNAELGVELEELNEFDTRKVESSNYNAQATSNSAGLRNSDIVEYAVDSGNATFYVSIDGNRALLKMGNGDVYPMNVYDMRYLYWLYDRLPQEKKTGIGLYGMGTEQEQLLGMFLRGEAEWLLYLEDKERRLKKYKKYLDDYLDDDNLYLAYPELREVAVRKNH